MQFDPLVITMDAESHSSERIDRISELSDSLILVILSLLPLRDVIGTTLLSKRWKDLWTSVHCLHFHFHLDNNSLYKFRSFIRGVVAHWKGVKILKCSISFSLHLPHTRDIDSLLLFAIEKQVEELFIDLGPTDQDDSSYCPPQRLYSCSSIRILSLHHCKLITEENVQWNQLKSLTVEGSDLLTEHVMNQILSGAPLLEVLNLRVPDNFGNNLNIESTSLKMLIKVDIYVVINDHVVLGNDAFLRIWAPNLDTLEISAVFYIRCSFHLPSLTNATLIDLSDKIFDCFGYEKPKLLVEMLTQLFPSICHAERLTLPDWCIQVLCWMNEDKFVPHSNCKILKLCPRYSSGLLDVVEMFPNVTMLVVEQNNEFPPSAFADYVFDSFAPGTGVFPRLSLPKLKTIDITWHRHDAFILQWIQIMLGNGHLLEKMVLRLRKHEARPERFALVEEKVLSMPRSSPAAEVIITKY